MTDKTQAWRDFANKAITVPFVPHGRDWDGFDCWGLVVLGYRDVLGIDLPGYESDYTGTSARYGEHLNEILHAYRSSNWAMTRRRLGAVACIKRQGRFVHVGLVVAPRHILHTEFGVGTVLDRDRDLNVEGFWEPAWTVAL